MKESREAELVKQAKRRLMDDLQISENAAHQFIVHSAMEQRLTKAEVAIHILRTDLSALC